MEIKFAPEDFINGKQYEHRLKDADDFDNVHGTFDERKQLWGVAMAALIRVTGASLDTIYMVFGRATIYSPNFYFMKDKNHLKRTYKNQPVIAVVVVPADNTEMAKVKWLTRTEFADYLDTAKAKVCLPWKALRNTHEGIDLSYAT